MPSVKLDGTPGRDLWDRLPGERSKVYQRFEVYRDIGPQRTMTAAARLLKLSYPTVLDNAQRFAWVERAEAWDKEMERTRAFAHRDAVAEMKKRQVQESKALQHKAVERLKTMELSELKPRDVLSFITEAAKMERMALGQPTEIVQRTGDALASLDLTRLTEAELASLEAIVAKAQSFTPPPATEPEDEDDAAEEGEGDASPVP